MPVFNTAGKYGAGMSLEVLGQCLTDLNVDPDQVLISNKLGWYQSSLETLEPIFEKGIWWNLKNDAIQKIRYHGIIDCFEQGNRLLGKYNAWLVSVHDPDEYLETAVDETDPEKSFEDILSSYRALNELKLEGKVNAIGIGSKDWKVIRRITQCVELDWVMIANSLTVHSHPKGLITFIAELSEKEITVINSAVFTGRGLIGNNFYNYSKVDPEIESGRQLLAWRKQFVALYEKFSTSPTEACFNFGFNVKGILAVALNTSKPEKVKRNIDMATKEIPQSFWDAMATNHLIQI
ncbi:aldo/keto reductase [Flavobacterium sp. FlaQc-48]|uniref:aldo/keto reductase n=1 Tax=Flavobacterium sp. FlaQc-48 TaxID=3374181 RepID=UPI003756AEEB